MPDSRTIEVYSQHAEEFAAQYKSLRPAFLSRLVDCIPKGGRILDIGCGSGRDMAAFMESGLEVLGVEPVAEFRAIAERDFPSLKGRIIEGALPILEARTLGVFDGVHCSAVLMHLAPDELFNSIFSIRELLKPGGIAHFSYCPTRPGTDSNHRTADGRRFNPINPDQLNAILRRAGFAVVSEIPTEDSLQRKDINWVSLIVRRDDGAMERPLQRIERIVNRDTKDATYKLALLRGLTELAASRFHEVEWLEGGKVAVQADCVANFWIRYYWPLLESPEFIAQKNGEKPGCAKPIKFRRHLAQLVETFRSCGSYPAYREAVEQDRGIAKPALSKVLDAIRDGPVKFASGGFFAWCKIGKKAYITMPTDFWVELSELSQWIEPAIRLRWAEETCRFSKGKFEPGEILSLLSKDYEVMRNVDETRRLFVGREDVACIWTSIALKPKDLEIDHVIPYSLWHNNELWNLVPAHKRVNNQKRDKIVSRQTLLARRNEIIETWKFQRAHLQQRFDRELATLIGKPPNPANWEAPAFHRLAEAIEATAYRRQAERWSA